LIRASDARVSPRGVSYKYYKKTILHFARERERTHCLQGLLIVFFVFVATSAAFKQTGQIDRDRAELNVQGLKLQSKRRHVSTNTEGIIHRRLPTLNPGSMRSALGLSTFFALPLSGREGFCLALDSRGAFLADRMGGILALVMERISSA
jgi:hypothetical protein